MWKATSRLPGRNWETKNEVLVGWKGSRPSAVYTNAVSPSSGDREAEDRYLHRPTAARHRVLRRWGKNPSWPVEWLWCALVVFIHSGCERMCARRWAGSCFPTHVVLCPLHPAPEALHHHCCPAWGRNGPVPPQTPCCSLPGTAWEMSLRGLGRGSCC